MLVGDHRVGPGRQALITALTTLRDHHIPVVPVWDLIQFAVPDLDQIPR
jgi:hypothetical protein